MDKGFEEHMRKELLARRAKLVRADAELGVEAGELRDGGDVDLVDHAQTATASEVVAQLDDKERIEVAELDAALERLAEGRYGVCAKCEEEIPRARLELVPEAKTCAACA